MSTNISKQKRDALLDKINQIKNYISAAPQDENTANLLTYIGELTKEINGKKYGLVFEEHREKIDELLEENAPVLVEQEDLFIDNGGEMNFLIEGDNLAALKLLEKTHKGKIDVILIDPPYNTGDKDFIYDDNYVDSDDEFKHSKWASFIIKRLEIAKKLLKSSGLCFIHIDDNEQSTLKILCDEIFGEKNFINCIAIKMSEATGVKMTHVEKKLPKMKEYILVYKKDEIELCNIQIPKDKWDEEYKLVIQGITEEKLQYVKNVMQMDNPKDEDIKVADEYLMGITFTTVKEFYEKTESNVNIQDFKYQNSKIIVRDVATTDAAKKLADEKRYKAGNAFLIKTPQNKIYLIKNGYSETANQPRIKLLFADEYLTYNPGDFWQDIKTTGLDNEGYVSFKKGKKPLKAEERIISLIKEKDAIILDFFAGSGTTGHSILESNKNDDGKRKFILCTNNQNNICRDITYKRLKNVIEKDKYPASLKYFKIDFLPIKDKMYYEYADELLEHVKELVELENAIDFNTNKSVAIVLDDDELDDFVENIADYPECKTLYMGHDVLTSYQQEQTIKAHGITINTVPDYYYRDLAN